MIDLNKYTEDDYVLFEALTFAMLGLVDSQVNNDNFFNFLEILIETNDIGGEPGWIIEKIELDKNLNYLKFNDKIVVNKLTDFYNQGYKIIFWVNSTISSPKNVFFTEDKFWTLVNDIILDYLESNPQFKNDYDLFKGKYKNN